jgi:hypothetical protein
MRVLKVPVRLPGLTLIDLKELKYGSCSREGCLHVMSMRITGIEKVTTTKKYEELRTRGWSRQSYR